MTEHVRQVEVEDGHEKHVLGPPGTGKTTYISARIRATVQARGSDAVAVASFTTAAAAELGGRGLPLHRSAIGTLHSHAYRSIDTPPVAAERLAEWNKAHPALAVSAPTGKGTGASPLDEPAEEWSGATEGDALMSELERLRNRMVDPELWPPAVRSLSAKWEAWKAAEGVVDFTDMVEHALRDTAAMPTRPAVGFFDETQDNTDLELALVRHWGKQMDRVVLAYDDDQQLYTFRGATADGLLNHPVPDDDRYVLGQSWRVPAGVHRAAEKWIRRVSRREEKLYLPRTVEGVVRQSKATFGDPKALLAQVELALTDRAEVVDHDGARRPGTVMVLASCGYMLDPLKHEMRAAGVPFHNPYRRRRGDWNPLGGSRGVSSATRLLSYLVMDERMFGEAARLWTGGDLQRWAHVVRTQGVFRRGAKTTIGAFPDRELTYTEVSQLFASDDVLEAATTPDLQWFESHLLAAAVPGMRFPLAIAGRYGGAALSAEPRVILGTIHSVKGGQSDCVFLIPDLSARGYGEWSKAGAPRDSVIRQFYVGMTRAREELVVCDPSTEAYVPPVRLVQGARERTTP